MLEISIYWEQTVLLSVPSLYKQLPLCWCTFYVHFEVLVLLVQVEFVATISDDPSTTFEWLGEASCASLDSETGFVGFDDESD